MALETVRVGSLNLELVIKEITEPDEFASYEALSQFHYRGSILHGRTAKLIVRNYHPLYPEVIGYVELATPFYMNKVRTSILDAPFTMNGIRWTSWDMNTTRRYIHLLVRVARCVIYPEFRGAGIGGILLKHAAEFARSRWQVSQFMPYFLEISADMLKFVPFASKVGMTFIGETEGNLGRVAKDLAYLLVNRDRVRAKSIVKEEACGIVDQQVARMENAAQIMERQGWNRDELIERLSKLSTNTVLRDFDVFHKIVSLPKPTYLQGLTPEAHAFVLQRVQELGVRNGFQAPTYEVKPISSPLVIDKVSLSYRSKVRRTAQTHAIQQAFSISPGDIEHPVIQELSLTLEPGKVVLVTGPSGSGKTSLMNLLLRRQKIGFDGGVRWPKNYSPKKFSPIRSQKALIEVLSKRGVKDALYLMGLVGLSDAFIYLKRFEELSAGQQYRAMLAQLVLSGGNVWIADEFCTNLDSLTANLVADRLQKIARQMGILLITASPQPESFVAALKPDVVVKLTTAWEHRVMNGDKFISSLVTCKNEFTFSPPEIRIPAKDLDAVQSGQKAAVVLPEMRQLHHDLILLKAADDLEVVRVVDVRYTNFRELTATDAIKSGVPSVRRLRSALKRQCQCLQDNSLMTVITFELLSNLKAPPL
jgi:ABC-type ATPase with predicted acetyltransferase domain